MQAARSVEGDPRAALEEAKAAVESQDEEAAHRHLDRALQLCAAQSDAEAALVRTEATYYKGTLLYNQQRFSEARPHLQSFLAQDGDDQLGTGDDVRSMLMICEEQSAAAGRFAGDAAGRLAIAAGGAEPPPRSQTDLNPAHRPTAMRRSGGRGYDTLADDGDGDGGGGGGGAFEQDAGRRGGRRGGGAARERTLGGALTLLCSLVFLCHLCLTGFVHRAGVCCGEESDEKAICLGICVMLVLIAILTLYGIAA